MENRGLIHRCTQPEGFVPYFPGFLFLDDTEAISFLELLFGEYIWG
ncbi:hypothetical protein [Virgibacillus sp. YIM 98842]|nr:hypothetical protein [Virgibacillus sp. YIM 98842]